MPNHPVKRKAKSRRTRHEPPQLSVGQRRLPAAVASEMPATTYVDPLIRLQPCHRRLHVRTNLLESHQGDGVSARSPCDLDPPNACAHPIRSASTAAVPARPSPRLLHSPRFPVAGTSLQASQFRLLRARFVPVKGQQDSCWHLRNGTMGAGFPAH